MFKKQPRMEVVAAAEGKKSCLVVGAGASGLAVMKELTALNHTVKCFDENVRIGGVYTSSYDQDDAHGVVATDRVQRLQ